MLFTNGRWPSQYRDAWRSAARQLRQRGIEIFAVGIGSAVDSAQLNDITENVYVGDDLPSVTPDIDYDTRTGKTPFGDTSQVILQNELSFYQPVAIEQNMSHWAFIHYTFAT